MFEKVEFAKETIAGQNIESIRQLCFIGFPPFFRTVAYEGSV
jgi:hypothetical protein